jgi:hypothetical protein
MNRKKNTPSKNNTDNIIKWGTLVLAGLSLVFSFTAIRKVNRMKDNVCVVVECPPPTSVESVAPSAPIVDDTHTVLIAP